MSHDDGRAAVPAKATLFCPDCGRRGNARTDWPERVTPTGDRTRYCPDCGTALTPCTPADFDAPATTPGAGSHAPADD